MALIILFISFVTDPAGEQVVDQLSQRIIILLCHTLLLQPFHRDSCCRCLLCFSLSFPSFFRSTLLSVCPFQLSNLSSNWTLSFQFWICFMWNGYPFNALWVFATIHMTMSNVNQFWEMAPKRCHITSAKFLSTWHLPMLHAGIQIKWVCLEMCNGMCFKPWDLI